MSDILVAASLDRNVAFSLRNALAGTPLLGFDTTPWSGMRLGSDPAAAASAKPAFVGTYEINDRETQSHTVTAGQTETVFNGGTASGSKVSSGGFEVVSDGGTASNTTISNGGFQILSDGGRAIGTKVQSGGFEVISNGATASTTTLSGGTQLVLDGGTASGTIVSSGGSQVLSTINATARNTTISQGGFQIVSGAAIGTTVSSGGFQLVSAFGFASGTHVSSGGVAFVFSAGQAANTIVDSGGFIVAVPGSTIAETDPTSIISTGVAFVSAGQFGHGAAFSGLSISGGASSSFIEVLSGGTTTGTTLAGGSHEDVYSGGRTSGTTLSNGGGQVVSSGGTASGTIISSGGKQIVVDDTATASNTVVQNSGAAFVFGGKTVGMTISSGGTEYVYNGGVASSTTVSNGGAQIVQFATASGTIVSNGGTQVLFGSGSALATTISSGGTLEIHSGGTASGTAFQDGGRLDLDDVTFDSGETANVTNAGLLTVTSSGMQIYSQQLAGDYTNRRFAISQDSDRSTVLTEQPVCFGPGTQIRTARGDVVIEALAVGEMVVTNTGAYRPIKWIGRRTVDCATHPNPEMVRPIRVLAGAFGEGRPYRDLILSPHHAVAVTCLDEVLIPIRLLVNGSTIAQIGDAETITYWHVELDSHDILMADGLPAESYIDVGNRCEFEGEAMLRLHPEFKSEALAGYCRPLVTGGSVLSAVRAQLAALAGETRWDAIEQIGFYLLADGAPIRPVVEDHRAAFVVPAGAGDLRLVSPAWSPRDRDHGSRDDRQLGLLIQSLVIDDLLGTITEIPLDHPGLVAGFHPIERTESGSWRWTDGDALLGAELWDGCPGPLVLRLTGQFEHAAAPQIEGVAVA